jgi:hypothetical protein
MPSFEPGDIIAPADKLKDWIEFALRVDSVEPGGDITAYDLGGGRGYRFDLMDQIRYDFVKVPNKLQHSPNWHSGDFYVMDEPDDSYRGWWNGQRWNGWAMPHFEFEEAMRFANDSPKEARTTYDKEQDAFVTLMDGDDEPYVDEGTVILVRGRGPLLVYPIGAGSWTWTERTDKEDDEDESSLDGRKRKSKSKSKGRRKK